MTMTSVTEGQGHGPSICNSIAYTTPDQESFLVSEVAGDWHELMHRITLRSYPLLALTDS